METAGESEVMVQKMLMACDYMGSWPAAARLYITMCLVHGERGSARMAQSFVEDSTGAFGIQNASVEFKQEVKERLLAAGFAVNHTSTLHGYLLAHSLFLRMLHELEAASV